MCCMGHTPQIPHLLPRGGKFSQPSLPRTFRQVSEESVDRTVPVKGNINGDYTLKSGPLQAEFSDMNESASDTGIAGKGKEKQPADRGRLLCSGWRLLFLGAQNTGNSAKNTACNLTRNFTCCSRNGSILDAADQ